jgi:hypothetical protein
MLCSQLIFATDLFDSCYSEIPTIWLPVCYPLSYFFPHKCSILPFSNTTVLGEPYRDTLKKINNHLINRIQELLPVKAQE